MADTTPEFAHKSPDHQFGFLEVLANCRCQVVVEQFSLASRDDVELQNFRNISTETHTQ